MIPVSLKLSNFTSYGTNAPTLDFTKFHLAAISGSNGAGKSSLLDAITWCIWGTSRLGDASDPLIRLGQAEMVVEFSFELDNHIFTVKRKRLKKSGGSTSLEFFSNPSAQGETIHNLTEGTIKITQEKIINALHLSYETFINSAFLRQGHADEFTTKGPTERKKILADILGLSHFDELEERAKEKVKNIQNDLKLLEYRLLEIEAELSQKEEREKKLSEAEKEAEETEKEHKELEVVIKKVEAEREVALTKLKSLEESKERMERAQKELAELRIQISFKERAKQDYQTILDQKQQIEESYQKLQQFQERRKVLEEKRSQLIKVKDEYLILQKTIRELEERRNKKVADLEVEVERVKTQNEQLEKELTHLREHKDICPTCKQTIAVEKNKEIIKDRAERLTINQKLLNSKNEELAKVVGFQLPQLKEAEEKDQEVKALEEETKDFQEVFQTISLLDKYNDLYQKLQQAQTAVFTQQEALLDLKKIYQTQEEQINKEKVGLEALDSQRASLQEAENQLKIKEQVKEALSQKALAARDKAGEARQLVSRTKQLEDFLEKRVKEKDILQKEKELYEDLAGAFGKKGIQAMIIETAVPEIEDEANKLLDRLTEGKMRVALETQRETKNKVASGEKGIIETLDIIISDEMGERPYESYSGGEAFRVNFALRLALSKLLTQRAGAKLQFLVIDEGFGTQDAQGKAKIVEVLSIIKDDFAKILVITHLEELKEEFPVRVEVQKAPGGSTFQVIGV